MSNEDTGYIDRMQIELDQLKYRAQRLLTFVESPAFDALPDADGILLLAQAQAMATYAGYLRERLTRATA